MKNFTLSILFFALNVCCFAQPNVIDKKWTFTGVAGIGRSSFGVDGIQDSPRYPTTEFKLGGGIIRRLGSIFELRSGISFGVKAKRESYFYGKDKQYTNEPGVLIGLDEASSSQNHFYVDVPLMVQVNTLKNKVGFRTGLNGRFWAANNDNVDMLSARREVGVIGGVAYRFIPKLSVGLDFYYGLTNIYGGSISTNNAPFSEFNVRNQFAHVTFEYLF